MKNKNENNIERQKGEREQKIRKGEKMLRLLEILTQGTVVTFALMAAFAPGTTYSMAKRIKKLPNEVHEFFNDARTKNQFYSLLSYLQKTGLVLKEQVGTQTKWQITGKGRTKREEIHYKISNTKTPTLSLSNYKLEKSNKLVAVIFDIPEKEKFKRDWLRQTLKGIGFSLVQESVWMGQVRVPKELMEDLKKLGLLSFVKIFSVVEIGNLD